MTSILEKILDLLPLSPFPFPLSTLVLVGGVLSGVRRWWGPAPAAAPAPVPYEVTCICGHVAAGFRKPEHQVVRCPQCGEELFILPLPRLPEIAPPRETPAPRAAPRAGLARWRPWILPVAAVLLTVLALVAAYYLAFAPRGEPRDGLPRVAESPGKGGSGEFGERLTLARNHVRQGNFRLALEELKTARSLCERQPRLCPPAERRAAALLYRQADVFADLLGESLDEVLRHASGVQEREWLTEFQHRYRGKAVVLRALVWPVAEGRLEHNEQLRARDEPAQLDLNDLVLLRRLPLDGPQYVLFGARLASVRREPGRGWVVRLEPDSGVLVTDPGAAIASFYSPDEPDVRVLLRRQEEWAAREPLEKPWKE